MKKIINGLRYDTEKAIRIGTHTCGGYVTDFSYWSASLYRTPRSGRFFLAGEGGAMTRFNRKIDNDTWCGGEALFPLTVKGALKWAEQYLDAEVIEEHFSDLIADA